MRRAEEEQKLQNRLKFLRELPQEPITITLINKNDPNDTHTYQVNRNMLCIELINTLIPLLNITEKKFFRINGPAFQFDRTLKDTLKEKGIQNGTKLYFTKEKMVSGKSHMIANMYEATRVQHYDAATQFANLVRNPPSKGGKSRRTTRNKRKMSRRNKSNRRH
jgi:hypothetical protein